MPEKNYGRCAGNGNRRCLRCWQNKMKHGNKLKKKKNKKLSSKVEERVWIEPYQITGERKSEPWWWSHPSEETEPIDYPIIMPPEKVTSNHFTQGVTITTHS